MPAPVHSGLATPTAVTVAMGRASEKGLLIRDAVALERLSQVTDIIYDKTETAHGGYAQSDRCHVARADATAFRSSWERATIEPPPCESNCENI